jgi:hypothetical protein
MIKLANNFLQITNSALFGNNAISASKNRSIQFNKFMTCGYLK